LLSGTTLLLSWNGWEVASQVVGCLKWAADTALESRSFFSASVPRTCKRSMSVLPLLGVWVGTLLAYYFSKENFEAATKSVTEMAREIGGMEKLRAIPFVRRSYERTSQFA